MRMKGRQTILGGCCTQCMLYSVYAVLGVCCTRCVLYSVYVVLGVCYTVLGVNSWSWHGEIERDDLTWFSTMMVELMTRKREMRTMWRIWADMRHQGYNLPPLVWRTSNRCNYTPDQGWWIDSHTKFSKSQFLMMFCAIASHLSRPHLSRHLRTSSAVIHLYLSMPWSRVNTEYSIHRIQHTPSTAYTEYCEHCVLHHLMIDSLPLPTSLSSELTLLYSIPNIPTIRS